VAIVTATLAGGPAAGIDEAIEVGRAKRDRQAFAPLYVRYFDKVYGYCYRRLGMADEAADATSMVFARALTALPTCRDEAFRSWLFAIAHNVLADHYRGRREERSLDDALEVPDRGQSPEEAAIVAEARATVTRLLGQLPDEQRHVMELRLAGLTSREIGEMLGKQPNAIDQAQFRAMTRLKLLAGNGEPSKGARR
jgi:RNA polymerase sigma-70 factor (ECF subfamily)